MNFAISTEPDGQSWLPPFSCDEVVEIRPATTRTAPRSMAPTPIRVDRVLLREYEAVVTMTVSGSRADGEKLCRLCIGRSALGRRGRTAHLQRTPVPSTRPEVGLSADDIPWGARNARSVPVKAYQ